jgi:outer membrane receptor protein involved in Fe transport
MHAFLRVDNLTNEEYGTYQSSNAVNLTGAGEAPAPPLGVVAGLTVSF